MMMFFKQASGNFPESDHAEDVSCDLILSRDTMVFWNKYLKS